MVVVKVKDIVKYIIKILIIVLLLFFVSKFFLPTSKGTDKIINTDRLISCLDKNIPAIKEVNGNEEKIVDKISEIDPLKLVVGMQLEMINTIQIKENIDIEIENENIETQKEDISIEHASTELSTQIIENNVPNKFTNSYNSVKIKNETSYSLTEEMLKPNITVNNKNIIIFHTHTCESYTPSNNYNYEQTGTYRTTNLNYSVVRVGDELTNQLNSYGYNVIHNKTYHDYPAYSGSYGRSLETVENLLKESKDTDIIIDLHRDAIGDYSYAPSVIIGDEQVAQLMFVIRYRWWRFRAY